MPPIHRGIPLRREMASLRWELLLAKLREWFGSNRRRPTELAPHEEVLLRSAFGRPER